MRNRFYSSVLLIASLVTLVFAVMSALEDNYFREWRRYQREYASMTDGKTAFEPGFKQHFLVELNRIDRCATCHTGLMNTDMVSAKQPFTKHPGDILSVHQPQTFGCSVCHQGQGLATNSAEAHANNPNKHVFWDEPVYSRNFTQASCRSCHSSVWLGTNGAPLLAGGADLFIKMGCNSCHKTGGVGGSRGPALDGVGSQPIAHFPMAHLPGPHSVENWQIQHLIEPQKVVPGSAMRNYKITSEDALRLSVYLMSLRDLKVPDALVHSRDSMDRDNPNGELLYKRNCSGCHEAGLKSRKDEILNWMIPAVRNPEMLRAAGPDFIRKTILQGRPGTPMESWSTESSGLSSREIDTLVDYIYSNALDEDPAPWVYKEQADAEAGKELYVESCKMCHGADGEGGPKGIRLTTQVLADMPDSFLAITIRDGRPGTSMNSFKEDAEFSDEEIANVTAYVKELQRKALVRRK